MSLKLNLGCGGNVLKDFENHDIDVDITRPLGWEENKVDFILAEHVYEHTSPSDGLRFLEECRRILKPGGILRLCVPVIDYNNHKMTREHGRDLVVGHGHLQALNGNLVFTMLFIAGFSDAIQTGRKDCDGHFREIGIEKDDIETFRCEATK